MIFIATTRNTSKDWLIKVITRHIPNIGIPPEVIVRIRGGTDDPVSLINVPGLKWDVWFWIDVPWREIIRWIPHLHTAPGPFQLVSRSRDHAGVDIHITNDSVVLG